MFGLPSFQKLIVLAIAIAVVWYGFKFLGRLKETRAAEARKRDLNSEAQRDKTAVRDQLDVEETVQCPTCGAYVPSQGATNCGKARCPY